MAAADALQAQAQLAFQGTVLDYRREVGGQLLAHGSQRRGDVVLAGALAQPHALVGGQQCGGGDLFGQLQTAQGVAGGDGAHAHLVLVVAFGGAREHAGRQGVFQRLGGPGAGTDLYGFEAVVDHRRLRWRAGQVARQAVVVAGVDQQSELAIEQVGDVADQVLQAVHGEGDMAAVEVPAVQGALGFGVEQRVVVGAVQLDLDELPQ